MLKLGSYCLRKKNITLQLKTFRKHVTCPDCGGTTGRVYSCYQSQLDDLPWQGICNGAKGEYIDSAYEPFCEHSISKYWETYNPASGITLIEAV